MSKSCRLKDIFQKFALWFPCNDVDRLRSYEYKQARLEVKRAALLDKLSDKVTFQAIDASEDNTDLHDQIYNIERVHPLADLDELRNKRLGAEGDDKRCFAQVSHVQRKRHVTSCIYVSYEKVGLQGGMLSYTDIPGNINQVKYRNIDKFEPALGEDNQVNMAILYTISSHAENVWEKGGRDMAGDVYGHLYQDARDKGYPLLVSTLSPVRGFSQWLIENRDLSNLFLFEKAEGHKIEASRDVLEAISTSQGQEKYSTLLMEYLLNIKDPVMNFHLGNGAYIGQIQFNEDNKQDWVMLNYVYDPDPVKVEMYRDIYRNEKIRVTAPHIQELVSRTNPENLGRIMVTPSASTQIFIDKKRRFSDLFPYIPQ